MITNFLSKAGYAELAMPYILRCAWHYASLGRNCFLSLLPQWGSVQSLITFNLFEEEMALPLNSTQQSKGYRSCQAVQTPELKSSAAWFGSAI